jgi:hypothetical protein
MPGSKDASRLSRQTSLIDHVILDQATCVYCGAAVDWCCGVTGRTRHLDHFIPVYIMARARQSWPQREFFNWLLPCCPTCNNQLNAHYFATFRDRYDFVHWRLEQHNAAAAPRRIPRDHPLASLHVPEALQAIVRPMTEYRSGRDFIILAPARLASGDWSTEQSLAERALVGCSSPITPLVQSGTAFAFSQALS